MGGVYSTTSSGEKSSRLNYKFQVVVESPLFGIWKSVVTKFLH